MIIDQDPKGLYLHIPFCRHLCGYCAFAKTDKGAYSDEIQINYLNALESEFKLRTKTIHPQNFETLYIGGGTPSRLHSNGIRKLFTFLEQSINFNQLKEITFEINPEDLIEQPDLLTILKDCGVNRISMGLQTFSEKGLEILERKTTQTQNLNAIEFLFNHFSGRISLDFILSWPGQSVTDLKEDLNFLKPYSVGHFSTYLLNYEPGTRLERDRLKGRIEELDEDISADLWETFQQHCSDHHYQHYEISSFCLEQQQSQHNITTWKGMPYLGLGAGAVSRLGLKRWTNVKSLDRYIETCQNNDDPTYDTETITEQMHWEEDLLLALRHQEGLDLQTFKAQHGLDIKDLLNHDLQLGIKENNWKIVNDFLKMTPKGWQLFDHWISDWMLKLEENFQIQPPKTDEN